MPLVSRPGMTPLPSRPLPPPTRARLQRLLTASIQALRRGRSAARAPARVITKPLPERIAPAASVRGDRRAKTGCYRRGQAVGPDLAPWPDRPQARAVLKPNQNQSTAKAQVAATALSSSPACASRVQGVAVLSSSANTHSVVAPAGLSISGVRVCQETSTGPPPPLVMATNCCPSRP